MMISEMVLIFMALLWGWWWVTFKLWFGSRPRRRRGYSTVKKGPNGAQVKPPKHSLGEKLMKRKGFMVWIGSWVTFWFLVYWTRIATSCSEINRGLMSNQAYSEEGGECKWERGNVCWHYTIEGIFRPFYWGREQCTDFTDDLDHLTEM
jgi:hypothetical protein